MQKTFRTFDDVKINYDISEAKDRLSKTWLVFVHGAGGNFVTWRKQLSFFNKKGYSTIALDLRGHGKSGRPDFPADYSLDNFSRDVYELLKHEKIKNFMLIGHCFGAMIITNFHRMYPRLSRSYILTATGYKGPKILKIISDNKPIMNTLNRLLVKQDLSKRRFYNETYSRYLGTGDYNIFRIYADMSSTSLKSWIFTYETLSNFEGTEILRSIKQKTLIIVGEKDSIFNVKDAKRINNMIDGSKLVIVPKANHIIVLNNPDILNKHIYDFVLSI